MVVIVVVGVLQLHLPRYLAENSTPGDYGAFPGLVLVAVRVASVVAALGIERGRRAGWLLGIGVAATSLVLYVLQETVGLPGLERVWWEPTRILSVLMAVGFIVLACRHIGSSRPHLPLGG
jgi:hypothetical protein